MSSFNTKYLAYGLAGIILGAWITHAWWSHAVPHGDTYAVYAEILGNPVRTAIGTFELKDSLYVDPNTGLQIEPKNLFQALQAENLSFEPMHDPDHYGIYTILIEHLTEIIIASITIIGPWATYKYTQDGT